MSEAVLEHVRALHALGACRVSVTLAIRSRAAIATLLALLDQPGIDADGFTRTLAGQTDENGGPFVAHPGQLVFRIDCGCGCKSFRGFTAEEFATYATGRQFTLHFAMRDAL